MLNNILIPVKRLKISGEDFELPRQLNVSCQSTDTLLIKQLRDECKSFDIKVAQTAPDKADIIISRDLNTADEEAYRLTITPQRINISSLGDAGAFYGVQTIREIIRAFEKKLPCCRIDDCPEFKRRGIMLDCSRGKVPKLSRLKNLVELFSHWKINELQLYVENVFQFKKHPLIGRGYSPFSPQDILRLQEYCKNHHIRLVGNLASFGHMEKILQIPAYRSLGEMQGFAGWPGGTTLCPLDTRSIKLVRELYEEFVPLYEAEDFNSCGDEPWELGKGRSALHCFHDGIEALYAGFMNQVYAECKKYGKRMNIWADVVLNHPNILKKLPKDIVLLNWDYVPGGPMIPRTKELVETGYPVMICPATSSVMTHGCRLEMGMTNISEFTETGLKYKVEGVLNTDWGDNGHRNMIAVALHNLAWGAANSWAHKQCEANGFTEKFCSQTFGVKDKSFSRAIKILGKIVKTNPPQWWDANLPYSTFLPTIQHLWDMHDWGINALQFVRNGDLAGRIESLENIHWPENTQINDKFLTEILDEFSLATQMDILASKRCLFLKSKQSGKSTPSKQLKALIGETDHIANELKRVWLIGNRPSLLRENLNGFQKITQEYRKDL